MLVDGAGNVGLIDHAQQILQRYRQQAGSGARQKSRDRIEIVAVDAVMTQHVAQHGQRMPARIVAFAGIDPERALQLEVAERAPARIGRQVVGVEGDERIGRIMVDAAERTRDRRARTSSPDTTRCPNPPSARESLPARCRDPRRSPRSDAPRFPARSPPAAPRTASAHRRRCRRQSRAAPDKAASGPAHDRAGSRRHSASKPAASPGTARRIGSRGRRR